MKIAIDLQACQTASRRRGIGRYSLELAKGIVRNRGAHQVHFLLNQAFREHDDALKDELADGSDVTFEGFRLLPVDGVTRERLREMHRINDEILNWRYTCCGADALHISSVFEGWADPLAHVGGRIADVPVPVRSATLYDLIPLLFADAYLGPTTRKNYITTLGVFQQMDLILTISESARNDAILKLDIPSERIVNIGAAVSGAFHHIESIVPERTSETLRRHGLRSRFVLYTGAADPRKNVEFLLGAYAALPSLMRAEVQLAIVCGLHEAEQRRLADHAAKLGIAQDVLLLGYIPDEDLNLLYNVCDLFVLPSLYEGFGLPLLEAMTCGACVIASNSSSMPEIVGRADVLFDPTEQTALTRMMRDLLDAPERRRELAASNLVRSRRFSWDNVARAMLEAVEESLRRKAATSMFGAPTFGMSPRRPRIALFSPFPPERNVIAEYTASILPLLARYFDIEVVVAEYTPALDEVAGRFSVHDIPEFRRRAAGFDALVYWFGDRDIGTRVLELWPEFRGIVVVDDFRACGRALQDVIRHARGIIVHSRYEQRLLGDWPAEFSDVPVRVVPRAAFARVDADDRARARTALRLSDGDLLIGMFGALSDATQFSLLLDAVACDPPRENHRRLHVAYSGDLLRGANQATIGASIARHPMRDRIRVTGPLDSRGYADFLAASDIVVSPTLPSGGEGSATLLRLLAAGCTMIVGDTPASPDLPSDVAFRVPVSDVDALANALRLVVDDTALRLRLREAAARWAREELSPPRVANQLAEAIAALATLDCARCAEGLVQRIGDLVAESGLQREVLLEAGAAISAGLELHPASGHGLQLHGHPPHRTWDRGSPD